MTLVHGIPPEAWAAGTAALLYGSAWAVAPTMAFAAVERVRGLAARTRYRIGVALLGSNVVALVAIAAMALQHPLIGRTAVALFQAPLHLLNLALPSLEWLAVPLWAAGVTAHAARLVGASHVASRLVRAARPDLELCERLARIAARAGVRPPRSGSADAVRSPVLLGSMRPTLLVPRPLPEGLTGSSLDAVLAHELGHLAHGDPWSGWLLAVTETAFFFHPAVWRLTRRLRHLRECAADDFAIALTDPRSLVEGLAVFASAPPPAAALASSGGSLVQRIKRILGNGPVERNTPVTAIVGASLLACGLLVADVSVGGPDHRAQMDRYERITARYSDITAEVTIEPAGEAQLDAWRAAVVEDPEDLVARVALLSSLARLAFEDRSLWSEATEHCLYMVRHHPGADWDAPALFILAPLEDRSTVDAAWESHLAAAPTDPLIVGGAAHWFTATDESRAVALFEEAHRLDPFNDAWKGRLAHFLAREGDVAGVERVTDVRKSEGVLRGRRDWVDYDEWTSYGFKIEAAVAGGRWGEARRYATEYLDATRGYGDDWNNGNAIHEANTVLGLAALQEGDVEAAVRYLREAGKTPGSPQLASFGPDSKLASALAERGRTEDAAAWLLGVADYWRLDDVCSRPYLEARAAMVRAGHPLPERVLGYTAVQELQIDCE